MKLTILSSFTHDVWKGTYESDTTGEALLEEIFRAFNRVDEDDNKRLEGIGFTQPSLSAGDVVAIDWGEDQHPQMAVCNGTGWTWIRTGLGLCCGGPVN